MTIPVASSILPKAGAPCSTPVNSTTPARMLAWSTSTETARAGLAIPDVRL